MPPAGKHFLTPRDLALALGASESSLKRWVDDGDIPASRTAGGHRRIAVADAVRFIRESRLPVLRPDLLGLVEAAPVASTAGAAPSTQMLVAAMRAGDSNSVQALLVSSFLSGASAAAICDGPVRAALAEIGELWRDGADGIAIEHQAVDACAHALATIRQALPEPAANAPVAIGSAVSRDPYLLPSLAASVVLREVGFRAINLGPDLPVAALLRWIERHRPLLVWRSASIVDDVRELRREIEELEVALASHPTLLVLGGRGLTAMSIPHGERTVVFGSLSELAGFARGLLTTLPSPPGESSSAA